MSKPSPIGFINDEFSARCQEAQGRPFLLTGVHPSCGLRVELTLILAYGQSGRGNVTFRLSGEVVQTSTLLSCNFAESASESGGIISPATAWHPTTCKDDYGIHRGSVALAHVMRSLILQQRPSLSVTLEQVAYAWKNLANEKKAKVSRAIANKLGALHGDRVVCEVRLNFDYDTRRGTENGPWNDGIPFDGRDIWQVTLVADDSMKNMWRVDPTSSFVNLGPSHRPRCWPWSNEHVLPYERTGIEHDSPATMGDGPNGAVSVHICTGPHGCSNKDHPHSHQAQAA